MKWMMNKYLILKKEKKYEQNIVYVDFEHVNHKKIITIASAYRYLHLKIYSETLVF